MRHHPHKKLHALNRQIKVLLVTNSLILVASAMFGPIYAIFVEDIGGDLLDASFSFTVFALAAAVTTFLSGKFADKIKENELIIVFGYAVLGLCFLLYIFTDSITMLLFVQVLAGFGEAIYSPAFDAVYSKYLDGEQAGNQWGMWESMNYITAAAGTAIGGGLAALFGFDFMFIAMSILSFASAFYILRLPRKFL